MSEEVKIRDAAETVLSCAITVRGREYAKGSLLTADDVKFLEEAGVKYVSASRQQKGDIGFSLALEIIGTKLSGHGLSYILDENGCLKFAAAADGIFTAAEERIARFNRMSDEFILNTISPYSLVRRGDVVARLEVLPPILAEEKVEALRVNLSGNLPMLSVSPLRRCRTALIYTRFYNTTEEEKYFSAQVKKLVRTFASLNLDFSGEYNAVHNANSVADSLQEAVAAGYDLIFIIPGLPASSPRDIVPSAVKSFTEEFVPCHVAQTGCSDMYLGTMRQSRIICVPYNYHAAETPVINEMITKAVVNEKIIPADFIHAHNIILPFGERLDKSEELLLQSRGFADVPQNTPSVAIIILAAGVSSRTKRNKLLVTGADEKPLFMNSVRAAIETETGPVFVITGHQHEELEEYLNGIDVNVVYNPDFRHGVKTSINLGLKLVPSVCGAAILLPADMPNITAKHLGKLAAAYMPDKERQLVMTCFKGVRRNPILWSRELFEVADLVPENAAIRSVFMEHEDYTTLVNAGSEKLILDVNYPVDVEGVEKS